MKRYKAAARVLNLRVGEEFSSADDERYSPFVDKGYLVEVGGEPELPTGDVESGEAADTPPSASKGTERAQKPRAKRA